MTDTTATPVADEQPETSTDAPTTSVPENPYAAARPVQPATTAPASNGLSIASLVVAIVAIPTGMTLASIAALVLGFLGRSREPQGRTLANWGIALGFVGIFGWLIFAIIGFAFVAPFALLGFGWDGGIGWGGGPGDFFDLIDRF